MLHDIAEAAAADTSARPQSDQGKVAGIYRSGMDVARIEADGISPLAPELARIAGVHDVPAFLDELDICVRKEFLGCPGFRL